MVNDAGTLRERNVPGSADQANCLSTPYQKVMVVVKRRLRPG